MAKKQVEPDETVELTDEIKKASEIKKEAQQRRAKAAGDKEFKVDVTQNPKNQFKPGYRDELIYTRTWGAVKQPKAVMLLLHGMVEHSLRYDAFAKKCNQAGIIVFCMDLRAHGHTAGDPAKVGQYDGDLFGDCVKDAIKFADELIEAYHLPLIICGHSYGSFLTQEFIQNYHQHAMAILIGSACMQGVADVALGKMVANCTKAFCGKDAKAKMIYKLTFGAYGKSFDRGNWLTRDEAIFDAYNQDPFCGNICSAQFYSSFFAHLSKLYDINKLNMIDKDKPILITSGELDPVGGKQHKLVDKLDLLYRSLGIRSVTYKLWKQCRHEVLNEINKDEIQQYIIDFIISNLDKKKSKDVD